MALSNKMLKQEPGEIEMLLPWHAAGTLNARDARRVEEALARDPELARQYAAILVEYAETIDLNESLGVPSVHAMQKLFATIDAEPVRQRSATFGLSSRIVSFFSNLSPRMVAWSVGLGALALLLQAAVIGFVLMRDQTATYQMASLDTNKPMTRGFELRSSASTDVLVRFKPEAQIADITTLLDRYQASIVDGAKDGMFRLRLWKVQTPDQLAGLLDRMQHEKIVNLAKVAP